MSFPIDALRRAYPALEEQVHGRSLIYLDNAATAQMPLCVAQAVQALELRRGAMSTGASTP